MSSLVHPDGIEIEIDLRNVRAEAERSGSLAMHAMLSTDVSRDIRSVIAAQAESFEPVVTVQALGGAELPPKFDAPQIIESIGIVLGPMIGVGGLAKLVIEIVRICRTKLLTTIAVKVPGGEIRMSGPDVSPEDALKLLRVLEKSQRSAPLVPHSRKSKVRIEAVAKDK